MAVAWLEFPLKAALAVSSKRTASPEGGTPVRLARDDFSLLKHGCVVLVIEKRAFHEDFLVVVRKVRLIGILAVDSRPHTRVSVLLRVTGMK
jgi:hypothetical protein